MTASYRSGTPLGRDGFGQLLRAEWTKFRTVRGWVVGLGAAALITLLVGLLGPLAGGFSCTGPDGQPCANPAPPLGPGGEPVFDKFYFVHQPLAGDGSITVRVTSLTGRYSPDGQDPTSGTQPWSKAGIIIKDGTGQGSAYAAMAVTGGNGVRMQHNYTGDIAGSSSSATPRWLRLTRSGDTITGHESGDGANWSEVGAVSLAGLPSTVRAGMFATSPEYSVITQSFGGMSGFGGPTLATARFDRVDLQGTWPDGARPDGTWTGDSIGADPAGAPGRTGPGEGFEQVDGGFTVSGSGDIAPIVAARGNRMKTIENGLVGAFAGLIAIIVVAATFMTSEYRRGLIHTSLTASPRRGRVLAAKAVVIGSVTFVVGLVAAGVAVPLIRALEQDQGLHVFPVPALTELRVVAGTAALLAVAAVFALAVGTVLRRSAGAVTVVIVAIVLPYIMAIASVLPTGPSDWLLRVTPAAAFAVQQSLPEYPQVDAGYTPVDGYFPLTPLAGFLVLCGYTALALGAAAYVLRRRDA